MTTASDPRTDTERLSRRFKLLRWLTLALGLLNVVAGVVVLIRPGSALATLAVVIGVFMLVDGILELLAAALGEVADRALVAIVGAASAIIGVLLIRHPIGGVVAVALLVGLWLLALGVINLVAAFGAPERRLARIALSVVELLAGIVIVSSPGIGIATLALLVGLAFIVRGVVLLATAWAAGELQRAAGPDGA